MTEFRTRVAGWEEPCHPGSTMHEHACPTLPHFLPRCNPTVTARPTRLLSWPLWRAQADTAWGSAVSRDRGRVVGACTISCSSPIWARACKIGAIPSGRCAQVPARGGTRRGHWIGLSIECRYSGYSIEKSGDGGQLENEPGAAFARRRGESPTVVTRDRRGDRQPATTGTSSAAGPPRQVRDRRR